MARKKDTPQKAALREMMGNYLKENNVKVKDGTDVNSIMRDMMSIILDVYDTLNLPKKASEFPEKSKGNSLNKAGHIDSPLHYIYPLSKHHQR